MRNGNPSDHAGRLHHPSHFLSLIQKKKATLPEPDELDDILARYSDAAKKRPPKFDDITFRPLAGASPREPQLTSPPAAVFPLADLPHFPRPTAPKPTTCPKCGKAITTVGGTEKGHSITCVEWWKNL